MRDAWWDLVHGGRCVVCARAGRALCADCEATLPTGGRRTQPTPCPPGLAPTYAAGEYADPLRALILAHKERHAFDLVRPLGEVLTRVLVGSLGHAPGGTAAPAFLVPVPSRPVVVRARGHDPMLRIARVAAAGCRAAGREVRVLGLLRQRLRVADQSGLGSTARAANLADSMLVVPTARDVLVRSGTRSGRGVEVVVCDDVLTTGATAREAQRALEESGIAVRAIACLAATRRRTGDSLPFSPPAH